MILIDALYINKSGGKVLLDYLVGELEKSDLNVFYLFDARCSNYYHYIPRNRRAFLRASLFNRYRFYLNNKNRFFKVFCFGNLPPSIKLNTTVITYFHQPMFLKIPDDFSLIEKFKYLVKTKILYRLKKNSNFWFVQNETIKSGLIQKYKLDCEKVLVMPFYPSFDSIEKPPIRKKFSYLYVSSAPSHKNHIRLIDAFCKFFDKTQTGELILTVGSQFKYIVNLISEKRSKGYPIVNVGHVNREELHRLYCSSEYLIFPSLAESFGLGLVEAIENGCKVIGSDLPYTYEVCEPSITFNPFDSKSIELALEKSLTINIPKSKQVISNKIDELIELVTQ